MPQYSMLELLTLLRLREIFIRDRLGAVSQSDFYKYYKYAFAANKINKRLSWPMLEARLMRYSPDSTGIGKMKIAMLECILFVGFD